MASKQEDGKAILESFQKAYTATKEAKKVLSEIYSGSGKEKIEKRITLMALLAQYKSVVALLDELHHSIGHSLFEDCWNETPVGEEFTTGGVFKQLFEGLRELFGEENTEIVGIDLDEPLPPDTPEAVRKKVDEIRKARAQAARAHLQ